jgi:hypothetical protein
MGYSLGEGGKWKKEDNLYTVSDSYPAFFLLIATTSNKNF